MTSDRATLRSMLRRQRKAFVEGLPDSDRGLAFRVIPGPVLARIPPAARIALYIAVGTEAPTDRFAEFLVARGHPLCLPRITTAATATMDFAAWSPEDAMEIGPLRIPQPVPDAAAVVPDVLFVPLLGFDGALNRMGQGAGYYDRALAANPTALRIGLAWSVQRVEALPVEPWDMPMHVILTEQRILAGAAA
jgi:5-formyltetrahydrofolate cyclo-ligase